MKAFSPDIFTEQKTSELLNESNSILPPAEKSLIAFKTDSIYREIEARRKFYRNYITESSDYGNISMDKIIMDAEIKAIHEAYEDYAKTHKANSVLLENSVLGVSTGDEDLTEVFEAFELEIAELTFKALQEEAAVFAEQISDAEKFTKLQAIDEDFKSKVKLGWVKTVNFFKQIFAKFIEKLRANITSTKNYMERYKTIILEKPFHNDEYTTQALETGYDRIINTSEVPQLNLQSMTNILDNKYDFGIDVISKKFGSMTGKDGEMFNALKDNKTESAWNEFLKTYFCMKNHETTYSGPEFQEKLKKTFYEFMIDARKIEQSIRKSIKDIEDSCNTIMKEAGVDPEGKTEPTPEAQPKEECYSQIFQGNLILENGRIILEVEVNNADQPAANNNKGDAPHGIKNVEKADDKQMENNKAAAKQGSSAVIPNRCKNYADACCGILRAKLSAVEFIRKEVLAIVRHHVNRYIGGHATPTEDKQQGNEGKKVTTKGGNA